MERMKFEDTCFQDNDFENPDFKAIRRSQQQITTRSCPQQALPRSQSLSLQPLRCVRAHIPVCVWAGPCCCSNARYVTEWKSCSRAVGYRQAIPGQLSLCLRRCVESLTLTN